MRELTTLAMKIKQKNHTNPDILEEEHIMESRNIIQNDGIDDNEKLEVNVENVMQNISKLVIIIYKI